MGVSQGDQGLPKSGTHDHPVHNADDYEYIKEPKCTGLKRNLLNICHAFSRLYNINAAFTVVKELL